MSYAYNVTTQHHPFASEGFKISREVKLAASVVNLTLEQDGMIALGEGVPLKRYGLTADSVMAQLNEFCTLQPTLADLEKLPAGPARFALDTALTALAAQQAGQTVAQYLGMPVPAPIPTAYTLSLDTPEKMARDALAHPGFKTLKLKLGNDDCNLDRLAAIQAVAPEASFILDANEAWTPHTLDRLIASLSDYPVILLEQPLPAGQDEALRDMRSVIPLAADESCHTCDDLAALCGKYQVANIKLDKAGGLHHALKMAQRAAELDLEIMIGCMGSTSLSIYPALLVAQKTQAKYVDLDGALLLADDPYSFVTYADGCVMLSL